MDSPDGSSDQIGPGQGLAAAIVSLHSGRRFDRRHPQFDSFAARFQSLLRPRFGPRNRRQPNRQVPSRFAGARRKRTSLARTTAIRRPQTQVDDHPREAGGDNTVCDPCSYTFFADLSSLLDQPSPEQTVWLGGSRRGCMTTRHPSTGGCLYSVSDILPPPGSASVGITGPRAARPEERPDARRP
jgi:hypothetical protein